MTELLSPSNLVLVAFLPTPKDFEIARVLGWYRIPLRTAPRVIAVDTLAFYQPATFGDDHKWCIEYYAPITGHELTTRGQLFKEDFDHPRAGEEYFKLQLGTLQLLPRPIPADEWKRLTFLYTTGERLLNARTIDDLSVHDEERQVLTQALRERAEKEQRYGADHVPEMPWDQELLAFFSVRDSGALYFDDEAE
jgi:hypothetical protein